MATFATNPTTAVAKGMKRAIFSVGSRRFNASITSSNYVRPAVVQPQYTSPLDDSVQRRHYVSARQLSSGRSSSSNVGNSYVSPFQEIFDTIDEGKTFLGTSEFQMPAVKLLRCGIPEHVLKFKTTSYGRYLEEPFVSPNEHKVTLQCHIRHIPLETDAQRLVLKEIVGNRLNDETGVLQLSSSQFGSRIENKRHAVSMLERIVETAKTLAARVEEEVQSIDGAAA
jgi:hypothetical protein